MTDRKNMFDGAKVKAMIADMGLTSIEIAKKAGISREQFSNYIHGRRNPKRITVQRIADALHVKISEISGYADENSAESTENLNTTPADSSADEQNILNFVASSLKRARLSESQVAIAERIGVSGSYISRLLSGEADFANFPLLAFLRLCPQLINRSALTSLQEEDVAAWLFRAIGGMNDSEKLMLKQVIETTMPRFACHGDSKNEKPELCTSECMGSSDSNGEGI